MLSRWKLPMLPTFMVLSAGYLIASRKEVDSVELPYLNRARLAYTATRFLSTGQKPPLYTHTHTHPVKELCLLKQISLQGFFSILQGRLDSTE